MYEFLTGLLKAFDDFQDSNLDIKIQYDHPNDNQELLNKYDILYIIGNGSTFEKVINLLEWVSKHVFHKGNYDNHVEENALALLDYSLDKNETQGINCKSLSILLVECLLTLKINSRVVYMMPMSPYDDDNHVVCEVYINELDKWIMIDPTIGAYVKDEYDNILNLIEIRNELKEQKPIIFSKNAHYNGNVLDKKYFTEYYAKNTFYFEVCSWQGKNIKSKKTHEYIPTVCFAPIGFDVKKNVIANIEYRIKKYGTNEAMDKWLKSIKESEHIYKNLSILY